LSLGLRIKRLERTHGGDTGPTSEVACFLARLEAVEHLIPSDTLRLVLQKAEAERQGLPISVEHTRATAHVIAFVETGTAPA
jgi:hypothetical protein